MASNVSSTTALSPAASSAPQRIQRLDEAVVNRIAAGEVVQRPANAIKEMMENCLDAGASSIQVVVKAGGLKVMQIQDNGCGIRKEDMMIVCERFTTSKLRKFEDLSNISTYGFRGEALASISHVAHATITTRTADSKCAYKASYSDGKLLPLKPGGVAEPRPCAGNQGTVISAEDLFYNIPTRKRALKPSEEYSRIADIITKYAIHNSGVGFSLKKQGEPVADVRTTQSSSLTENISTLYGASVARELLSVSCANARLGFKMSGHVTNANYSVKRLQFILFINHRLVDSASIRKAIECVYAAYLPKNMHPFVYLSIEIAPANIDVNVHPTKHEVHFLHEDVVVESVQKAVEDGLLGCNVSRTYYTQALLPTPISLERGEGERDKKGTGSDKPSYAYQMVRTDSKEQKLDAFVVPRSLQLPATLPVRRSVTERDRGTEEGEGVEMEAEGEDECMEVELVRPDGESSVRLESIEGEDTGEGERARETETRSAASKQHNKPSAPPANRVGLLQRFSRKQSRKREVSLTSVLNLQQAIRTNQHRDLTELFQNHKFVGCVDQTRALIQHQTKLYLVDLSRITRELFYQLVIFDFANFGELNLTPPAPVYDLVTLALELPDSGWTPEHGPKEKIAQYVVDLTKEKAEMLKDYFSIAISKDGLVHTLPLLLSRFSPNLDHLPLFILRVATEVNWEEEKECFQTLATELGQFYGLNHDPFLVDSSEEETRGEDKERGGEREGEEGREKSQEKERRQEREKGERGGEGEEGSEVPKDLYKRQPWKWTVEHVIFPALRSDFLPPKKMAADGSLLQIADLHDLYKVFERC